MSPSAGTELDQSPQVLSELLSMHDAQWIAACHESGHAVAAYLLGVPTESVGIHTSEAGEGKWTADKFNREAMKTTWIDYAVIGLMGKQVELLLFGGCEDRYLKEDEDNIECSVSIEVAQSTPGIKKQPPPLSVVRFPDAIPGSAPCGGAGLGTA